MKTINFFKRVLTIITAGVLALVFVLLNEIRAEYICADYTHTSFSAPCDATIKGNENTDLQPIKLRGAGTYNLILENVYLDLSNTEECALYIENGTNVNLILVGVNTLISGDGKAGISVECDSTLKIDGEGSLLVRGGDSDEMGGAGIGGSFGFGNGNVEINGGNITAEGGYQSAGIGGSNNTGGSIEINGGIINARGGQGAAGIGGGYGSRGGDISINGGTIIATAGSNANDIGGGADFSSNKGSTIITGGSVNNTTGSISFGKSEHKFRFDIQIPNCINQNISSMDIMGYNYSDKDIYTDSKEKIYLWLPRTFDNCDISIEVNGMVYVGTVIVGSETILLDSKNNISETESTAEGMETTEIASTTESYLEEIETTITETTISNTETASTTETKGKVTKIEEVTSNIKNKEENEVNISRDEISTIKNILLNKDKSMSDYEVKNVFDIVYIKQSFLYR